MRNQWKLGKFFRGGKKARIRIIIIFKIFLGTKPATIFHRPSTHQAGGPMSQRASTHRQWLDNHSAAEQPSLPTAGLQLVDLAVYLSILFVVSLIVGKLKSVMLSHETLKAG